MSSAGQFLVEWYGADLSAEPLDDTVARLIESAATMSACGKPVRLLLTLDVPDDEIVFAVFDADSSNSVAEACQRAGIAAQRLTAAVDARFPCA